MFATRASQLLLLALPADRTELATPGRRRGVSRRHRQGPEIGRSLHHRQARGPQSFRRDRDHRPRRQLAGYQARAFMAGRIYRSPAGGPAFFVGHAVVLPPGMGTVAQLRRNRIHGALAGADRLRPGSDCGSSVRLGAPGQKQARQSDAARCVSRRQLRQGSRGARILAPFTQDPASASMAQRNPICSFDADGMAICRVLPRTSILLP